MEYEDIFTEVIERLKSSGLAPSFSIRGCTEQEIASLEKLLHVQLPKAYRSFLKRFGKKAGKLFEGTDCFYDQIPGLYSAAELLLVENKETFTLPNNAFVFSMHQGYEFLYFITSDGDDPAIYQYVEGQGPPTKTWSRFTENIVESVDRLIALKPS